MRTSHDDQPHFTLQWRDIAAVVHLHAPLLSDPCDIAEIRAGLTEVVTTGRPPYVIVNFAAVTRCSTEMIGALLKVRHLAASYGGQVHLCGLRSEVREGYRILRLDGTLFPIHDSVSDAISATLGYVLVASHPSVDFDTPPVRSEPLE